MSETHHYRAYTVEDYTDRKTGEVKQKWNPAGAAFAHGDGKGFDLIVPQGLSLSGRITIRQHDRPDEATSPPSSGFNTNATGETV